MEGDNFENNQTGNQDPNTQASDFAIPDEYKEKGWAKFFDGKTGEDLKTELFKSYDNSQVLIGKKIEDYIGNTDLKNLDNYETIKENLIKQIAPQYEVPQNSSEYDLKSMLTDDNGEKIFEYDDEALNSFADKFKEIGLSKDNAKNLLEYYINYSSEQFQKLTNADDLENALKTMFGETSTKSEQRIKAENLLKEFLPEKDRVVIQNSVPNNIIEMFYKVAKGLTDKYGYSEGSSGGNKDNGNFRMSEADKDSKLQELYKKLEELDSHPQKVGERDEIIKQMQELYK